MAKAITSTKRAKAISTAIFFVGLAIISFRFSWWPSIMLVIGISLGVKNYLCGKLYDMLLSLIVFVGVFVTAQFDVSWEVLLPIVFTLAALYILVKEFTESSPQTEVEVEEDLNHELEEENKDQ